MNSLFAGIWNHFSATTGSGFYNDVSGRMYLGHAPQESTFPYCVYFSVSDFDELDFTDEREDFLIQFNVFSENNSATQAGTLLESLKTMFDNCSLTVTNWRHLKFQRSLVVPNNDLTQQPPIHGYSIEYDVLLEKARS
ncbi:MAG: hypothetical protein GY865_05315 [candidate division Zixibacteria bacterium]|nr:hypothetical protein [candidate division Zixibacteria bacterium]